MLILIVGKSASGKDTLADELARNGLVKVISRTTRPQRNENENTHIFVSEEQASEELPRAIAQTNIAGYDYYTIPEDLDYADIYIVDPSGVKNLTNNMPDDVFYLVYIHADDEHRFARAISRADDGEEAKKVFAKRNADESDEFDEFEDLCRIHPEELPDNIVGLTVINNDYVPTTLSNMAAKIVEWKRQFQGVATMVRELSRYNVFDIDESNHFLMKTDHGPDRCSYETVCAIMLQDNDQLAALTRAYLGSRVDTERESLAI